MRTMLLRRLALVVVIVLALGIGGAVGYVLGRGDRQVVAPETIYPAWTDQEIKSLGGGSNFATLRCTYHLADGTSRVTETLIVATTQTALASRTCPGP